MEVFDAVRTVLAVREYQEKPVQKETVRRIVEAAHLSASSMNKQPWHFVVVDDRGTLGRLGELVKTGPYIGRAPLAVVVGVDKGSKFGVSDVSRAVQSMILVAWADGVGSNWAGFGGLGEVGKLVGVPDEYEVLAVIPFGYPAHPVGKGEKARKPLAEIASHNRYSQPFEGR